MNLAHYGVVVGIDCYPSCDLTSLRSARRDAIDFYDWLIDGNGGGLEPENVIKVIDEGDEVNENTPIERAWPTRTRVAKALTEIRDKAQTEITRDNWHQSRLYFFVAGHGVAPDPKDSVLLMADTLNTTDYGNSLSCASVLKWFTVSQHFRELAFFADCCRRDIDVLDIGLISWSRMKQRNGEVVSILGCATYFGHAAYEPSREEQKEPDRLRGYYTQALLEGLGGRAVDPVRRRIDSVSLAKYCRRRVRHLTRRYAIPQVPTMDADTAAPSIVFRQNIPQSEVDEQMEARRRELYETLDGPERNVAIG